MEQGTPRRRTRLPFSLQICGVGDLSAVLKRFRPTHVISIIDPNDDPQHFPEPITALHLSFLDLHTPLGLVGRRLAARGGEGFPTIDHADAILQFGRQLPPAAKVLVHCWAGHSRSPAAAFLLAAQCMPGNEMDALKVVMAIRPEADPNAMIVQFGDRLLGAKGRMTRCLDDK